MGSLSEHSPRRAVSKTKTMTRDVLEIFPESFLLACMPCCPMLACLACYSGMNLKGMLSRTILNGVQLVLWLVFLMLDMFLRVVYCPLMHFQTKHGKAVAPKGDCEAGEKQAAAAGKTVVIVGGSFGGLAALRHLTSHEPGLRVILVDQREYFEYIPGILRLFCDPGLFHHLARFSPQGTHEFILGTVSCVNSDHIDVVTGGGTQRVDFDYLIMATGADYSRPVTPSPLEVTLASREASWQKEAAKVKAASSILVLGGGAVGVELAAEIVCHFPNKRVTIVDAAPGLLPLFPAKVAQHAQSWFEERGVELVLGEPLEKWDEGTCTTKSGRVIAADAIYVCFGSRCNSQCVAGGGLAESLGPRKEVRVNDYLQVEGWPHVFAVGDVMAHPAAEIKQAYYAEMNGEAAATNVIHHSRREKLAKYPDAIVGAGVSPLVYVVSLGRYDGALGFNELVISGMLPALVKWVLEWTKVRQMEGRPIGHLIWLIGDQFTFFLSRNFIKPKGKS